MKKEILHSTLGALLAGSLGGCAADRSADRARGQLDEALDELLKTPATHELDIGAMCYFIDLTPERLEYICPVCNSKTLYLKGGDYALMRSVECLDYSREWVAKIKKFGVDATLDETPLCDECRKKTNEQRCEPVLNINADGCVTQFKSGAYVACRLVEFFEKENNPQKADNANAANPPFFVRLHAVEPGDTLYSLAKKYGSTVQKIFDANKDVMVIEPDRIEHGKILIIPIPLPAQQ